MEKSISYKSTINACYIGNFVQASVVNLTPIIFIPLREQFGLSYIQFGFLILINFITQVIVDIAFSKAVDKHGFRIFSVAAHIICVIGFIMFAFTPWIFKGNEYIGFLISTIVFSGSGGLLELLLSAIVDAVPTDEKEKAMSILHSFYAWGQVSVVVITTLFLFIFGSESWYIIVLLWAILPLINTILFAKVPLAQKLHESQAMKIRELILNPIFIIAFFAIAFGAASEVTIAQWSSSFMEKGLKLPKVIGDIFGMCGFALMLGIGRLIYGIYGNKININKVMIYGSFGAIICYIVIAVSPFNFLSLLACCISGICVSLLWPGTLVVASEKLPLAGASLFALLAAGGDIGASIGPWLTGVITDMSEKIIPIQFLSQTELTIEQLGLRAGILLSTLYPLSCLISHLILKKKSDNRN